MDTDQGNSEREETKPENEGNKERPKCLDLETNSRQSNLSISSIGSNENKQNENNGNTR